MAREKEHINLLEQSYTTIATDQQEIFIRQLINLDDNKEIAKILLKQKAGGEENINLIRNKVNASPEPDNNKYEKLFRILNEAVRLNALVNSVELHSLEYTNLNKEIKNDEEDTQKLQKPIDFLSGLHYLDSPQRLDVLNDQYRKNPENITEILSAITKNPDRLPKTNREETINELKIVQQTPKLLEINYAEIRVSRLETKEALSKTLGIDTNQLTSKVLDTIKEQFLSGVLNLDEQGFNTFLEQQYKISSANIKNISSDLNTKSDYSPELEKKQRYYVGIANKFLTEKSAKLLDQPYSEITSPEERRLFVDAVSNLSRAERNDIFLKQKDEDYILFAEDQKSLVHKKNGVELLVEFGKALKEKAQQECDLDKFLSEPDKDIINNASTDINIKSDRETPKNTQEKIQILIGIKEIAYKPPMPPLPDIPGSKDNRNQAVNDQEPTFGDKYKHLFNLINKIENEPTKRMESFIKNIIFNKSRGGLKEIRKCFDLSEAGNQIRAATAGFSAVRPESSKWDIKNLTDAQKQDVNKLYDKVKEIISTRVSESKKIRSNEKQEFYEDEAKKFGVPDPSSQRPGKH